MIEKIVLANLVNNEPFTRKVLPYLLTEYFQDPSEKAIFEIIQAYIVKYNALPTKEAIMIDVLDKKLSDEVVEQCGGIIDELNADPNTNFDWICNETEKFCRERAIKLALIKSLEIIDGKSNDALDVGAIPDIMSKAIGTTFDSHLCHDYYDDAGERWDHLHTTDYKTPFDIEMLNKITRGGVMNGSLNIFIAGTNVGKSALMCSMAASNLKRGMNVLYITLEIEEELIAQRIDANIIDITIDESLEMGKDEFKRRVQNAKNLYGGKVKVKQYPDKQAGSSNFRYLLKELKLKNNFVPDIIYIDYINICNSSTMRNSKAPLDQVMFAISSELRGLAVEFNLPIVTATQFNREGFKKESPNLDDIAQAFNVTWTGDLIVAIVRNDEMDAKHQMLFIQLKNRYSEKSLLPRFLVGVNLEKMKFFDIPDPTANQLNEAHEAEIGLKMFEEGPDAINLKDGDFAKLF